METLTDLKNFTLGSFNFGYKNLKAGDKIKIKKQSDNNVIFTLNTGKKEFILPFEKLKFMQMASIATMEKIFINPDKSFCISKYGTERHLENMTDFGRELFTIHPDADSFIQILSWED